MDPTKTAGGARRRLAVVLVFAMAAATIAVVSGGGAAGATDDGSSAGAVSFDKPSAVEVTATLVQTLDTSTIVPGSPDPAGISYLPGVGNLVFTDSE
ncbi:MAG: hypothetical protein ACE5GB_11230, partial [Acidimicrobiales bacterium]